MCTFRKFSTTGVGDIEKSGEKKDRESESFELLY
jgi:hypothetical protein